MPIPVVGTVIGASIGMLLGWIGSKAYDWLESGAAKKSFDKKVEKTS